MGPYRLEQEPYYKAMEAKAADDPELLESYPRQLVFTAGYVASRPSASALMFLDNIYRLYDRPANDYKWDYPFSYSIQIVYQKFLLVAAIAGLVVVLSRRPSWAFVFFIPVCLALLHALSYQWPRFNQPAMPILIAGGRCVLCLGRRTHATKIPSLDRDRHRGVSALGLRCVVTSAGT